MFPALPTRSGVQIGSIICVCASADEKQQEIQKTVFDIGQCRPESG